MCLTYISQRVSVIFIGAEESQGKILTQEGGYLCPDNPKGRAGGGAAGGYSDETRN